MKLNKINYNKYSKLNTVPVLPAFTPLSRELHSILIGILLGDGSLYQSSPTANVRLEMSFGEKYGPLALKIGELFKEYMSNPVKSVTVKGKNLTLKGDRSTAYLNYRLKTQSLPVFVPYFNMFYKWNEQSNKFVKIVPTNILSEMNPITLAYLIMGDGNWDKGRNRVRIYTNSFTKEEVESLAFAINTQLNIYTGVLHDRKNQWILTIGAKNLSLLRETVKDHFHKSMLYRIGL